MTELIYSERFLKFIKVAFLQQIEAGKMKPAYIFESDIDSPFNRVGALEVELRQSKINGNIEELRNEINGVKQWIEYVHKQGEKINALHGEGKTELKYLTYSYSGDKFTSLGHAPDVKFKFKLHHDYFAIIEYFREVYKILEMVVPDEKLTGTTCTPEKLRKIFDKLAGQNIVKNPDKENFLSIFTGNQKALVYWNDTIRGAKAGLFDLMQRITGKDYSVSELKIHFNSNKPIHKKWKDKTGSPTKLIDAILREI